MFDLCSNFFFFTSPIIEIFLQEEVICSSIFRAVSPASFLLSFLLCSDAFVLVPFFNLFKLYDAGNVSELVVSSIIITVHLCRVELLS